MVIRPNNIAVFTAILPGPSNPDANLMAQVRGGGISKTLWSPDQLPAIQIDEWI